MALRPNAHSPRTAAEWSVRAAIAVAACALAYGSVTRSLAATVRVNAPARAHAIAPSDAQAAAILAQSIAGAEADTAERFRADVMARDALRRDPTVVGAVSTLGLDAQIRGDTRGARRAFAYAEALSRRDLQTQLWGVEDAVSRGDVRAALRHYDIALRTTPSAPDLLYPILSSALADAPIRTALVRTLSHRPPWGGFFIDYASGNSTSVDATAAFFTELRRVGVAISPSADATLTNALARHRIDAAWAYYSSSRGGLDPRFSRNPRFAANPTTPSLFDWVPNNSAGVTASVEPAERGFVFQFSAPAGVGGPALQQIQILSPGRYRLAGQSSGIDQPDVSAPYWLLTCGDGRELVRLPLPLSINGNRYFGYTFDVPSGCPMQTLTLIARPSDAIAGVSGQIRSARIVPLQIRR